MKKFAVFDIDGTLLRWQLFHGFVTILAKQGLLGNQALQDIRAARLNWKQRAHSNAFRDYEETLVRIYLSALTDITPAQYDAAVQQTIAKYKDQVYHYTKSLVAKLKQDGYMVFAISGSHSELVEQLTKYYGFDDSVGTVYERQDGKFTGKRIGAFSNKHLVLQKLISKHSVGLAGSIGVGDTASDISMLEMVEHPIAFNPNQELFDYASRFGWKIVVERKNVVYQLESKDGTYQLLA